MHAVPRTHPRTHTHVCVCTCMWVHHKQRAHTHVCVRLYMHTYARMHTHTHTHRSLRALRAYRALRPLRLVSKLQSVKVAVECVLKCIPECANVMVVCALCWLMFAILGVHLYEGRFHRCLPGDVVSDDPVAPLPRAGPTIGTEIYDWLDCIGGHDMFWVAAPRRFDNIFLALCALMECATFENWMVVMNSGVDATGPGLQPRPMAKPMHAFYFVVFLSLGGFYALSLFVGVIIHNFKLIQEKHTGYSALVTEDQQMWVNGLWVAIKTKPVFASKAPRHPYLRKLFHIVESETFDNLMMFFICANVLTLATLHTRQSEFWSALQTYVGTATCWIFVIEAVLKLAALGFHQYLRVPYNVFDFFVAILSLGSGITEDVSSRNVSPLRLVRVIARMVRLLHKASWARDLRQMLVGVTTSLPSLASVGLLLLVLHCVYAILGQNLFWNVAPGKYFSTDAHFEDFDTALVTLFRCITGESWSGIMHEAMAHKCKDDSDDSACGGYWTGLIFFYSFYILGAVLLYNVFVAAILDNLTIAQADAVHPLSPTAFGQVWKTFDPYGHLLISTTQVESLLVQLRKPLGFSPIAPRSHRLRMLLSLHVPVHNGLVGYAEIYERLSSIAMGLDAEGDLLQILPPSERVSSLIRWKNGMRRSLERRVKRYEHMRKHQTEYGTAMAFGDVMGSLVGWARGGGEKRLPSRVTFAMDYAVRRIQEWWTQKNAESKLRAAGVALTESSVMVLRRHRQSPKRKARRSSLAWEHIEESSQLPRGVARASEDAVEQVFEEVALEIAQNWSKSAGSVNERTAKEAAASLAPLIVGADAARRGAEYVADGLSVLVSERGGRWRSLESGAVIERRAHQASQSLHIGSQASNKPVHDAEQRTAKEAAASLAPLIVGADAARRGAEYVADGLSVLVSERGGRWRSLESGAVIERRAHQASQSLHIGRQASNKPVHAAEQRTAKEAAASLAPSSVSADAARRGAAYVAVALSVLTPDHSGGLESIAIQRTVRTADEEAPRHEAEQTRAVDQRPGRDQLKDQSDLEQLQSLFRLTRNLNAGRQASNGPGHVSDQCTPKQAAATLTTAPSSGAADVSGPTSGYCGWALESVATITPQRLTLERASFESHAALSDSDHAATSLGARRANAVASTVELRPAKLEPSALRAQENVTSAKDVAGLRFIGLNSEADPRGRPPVQRDADVAAGDIARLSGPQLGIVNRLERPFSSMHAPTAYSPPRAMADNFRVTGSLNGPGQWTSAGKEVPLPRPPPPPLPPPPRPPPQQVPIPHRLGARSVPSQSHSIGAAPDMVPGYHTSDEQPLYEYGAHGIGTASLDAHGGKINSHLRYTRPPLPWTPAALPIEDAWMSVGEKGEIPRTAAVHWTRVPMLHKSGPTTTLAISGDERVPETQSRNGTPESGRVALQHDRWAGATNSSSRSRPSSDSFTDGFAKVVEKRLRHIRLQKWITEGEASRK
jgi:hypothetical protein